MSNIRLTWPIQWSDDSFRNSDGSIALISLGDQTLMRINGYLRVYDRPPGQGGFAVFSEPTTGDGLLALKCWLLEKGYLHE